jgi:hypothetical protein
VQRIAIDGTDPRGFRRSRGLPPAEAIEHPAIRSAVEEYDRAHEAAQLARREAVTLEQERPAAVEADTEAYADALEAGRRDPGTKHTEAHDRKIADARRHVDALELIEQRAFTAMVDAIEAGQVDWHASVMAQHDAAREQAADALTTLTTKLGELARLDALRRYTEGRSRVLHGAEVPEPARLRGDERVDLGVALGVLQGHVEPPAPPRRLQYRESGGELRDVQPGSGKLHVVGDAA